MKNAACAPLLRESLADQIADRLSDIDELIGEVEQRRVDKQEISRLCRAMENTEKEFRLQERVPDDGRHLQDELRPYKKQIGDLYEAFKPTVLQIEAFASSLQVPLTLCTVEFPQIQNHRRALGQLSLVQHYGSHVSWDSGYEALTASRHLLKEIHNVVSHGSASVAHFPTPSRSSWEDLKIRFLSDHRVQITMRDVSEYRNYAEMGLENRSSHQANESWKCLRKMAIEGSIRCADRLKDPSWRAVEKRVERLGKALREVFGIAGSPFHPYRSADGYKPRFRTSFPQSDRL